MEQITSPIANQAPQADDRSQRDDDRRAERAQRHAAAVEAAYLLQIRSR